MGRSGVSAFRLVQVVTLGFAILVALRRSFNPASLLGSMMLASMATLSLVLPSRMAVFWDALPEGWSGCSGSVHHQGVVGPLLFAFAAVFPQRVWPKATIVGRAPSWSGCRGVARLHGRGFDAGPGSADGTAGRRQPMFLVNVSYAVLATGLLGLHRTAAHSLTDRRRIDVLMLGIAIGTVAAVGVVVGYRRNPGAGVFATPAMTLLALAFLAMPASFAYAILRHRLFNIRLIVRQGLRYALARRVVDGLIPVLGALLAVDSSSTAPSRLPPCSRRDGGGTSARWSAARG